jgi:hypothetical protein
LDGFVESGRCQRYGALSFLFVSEQKKMFFVRLTMTRQTVGKSWKQGDQIGRFFSVLGSFLLLAVILKMTQVA